MQSLSARIKFLITEMGAPLIGIASLKALSDAPPSADPRYLLPDANAVISFALPLDRRRTDDFLAKRSWSPHCADRKETVQKLYRTGDRVADLLRSEGFSALNVDINNNYRPEEGAADVSEMTEFHPQFSHRYAAVAAGIGRLGWSGNLMTREYGALVELGSVITSADLPPDTPIPNSDHPCDGCRVCTAVCPVGMIPPRGSTSVRIGGVRETIARKAPNTCCWIGCSGYEGLSRDGTWSNWSPFRLGRPLPKTKAEIDKLCISLQKADPQMQEGGSSFADYRAAVFNPDWNYYTVCGFCRSVCASTRSARISNRKAVHASGTAALSLGGRHVVAAREALELDTPFGLRIAIDVATDGAPPENLPGKPFPLEHAALSYVRRKLKTDLPGESVP